MKHFQISPITILIGPNSSGKSSLIHSIATLGQTASIPNASSPLILDHEFSDVHLGRFIDVIHSKRYSDSIKLGLSIPEMTISVPQMGDGASAVKYSSEVTVEFVYRSTLRTQEVFLETFELSTSQHKFSAKYTKGQFAVVCNGRKATLRSMGPFTFYPETFEKDFLTTDFFILQQLFNSISKNLKSVRYLGPFRQSPQRFYANKNSKPEKVGPEGEYAISMLASEVISKQKRNHQTEISRWMQILGLGNSIALKRQGTSDQFTVDIGLADTKQFPIPDLGYGISQIIPVLAQCSFAPHGSLLLFEQPEIHLHSSSAINLASIFVESINSKNLSIVCETHSKEFVFGLLRQIREGRIDADKVSIYKIRRENLQTEADKLDIDDEGEIYSNWASDI